MNGCRGRRWTGVGWNVPNVITFSRVILTCCLAAYIWFYFGQMAIPLLITGLIFFTDYVDGKIARRKGTVTPGGAVFDLFADFFYMVLAYLVLYDFRLIPFWFLMLVFFKFVEFLVTSFILQKAGRGSAIFAFDLIGRLVAGLFYLLPILLYVAHWSSAAVYDFFINKLTYMILFLSLVSSVYRFRNCFRRRGGTLGAEKAMEGK